jgi:hypothetical protein
MRIRLLSFFKKSGPATPPGDSHRTNLLNPLDESIPTDRPLSWSQSVTFIFWASPVLHPKSERQLSSGIAYGEDTTATCAYAFCRTRCDGCGTSQSRSKYNTSTKYFAVTMRTTALPGTSGHCCGSIGPGSIIGAECRAAAAGKGTIWWKYFHQIKERTPLLRPKLYLSNAELQAIAVL